MSRVITCYTDGSCNNRTGIGGFGVVLRSGEHCWDYFEGQYTETTSTRMEIMAIIKAIELINPGWEIIIHTDNQNAQKTINIWLKGWIHKGILESKANADLWKRFKEVHDAHGTHLIKVKWVKGHAGNKMNELADELANRGRLLTKTIVDKR